MREIYFDNCATTQVSPVAAETALRLMTSCYGNPSSLHKKGIEAQLELNSAREKLAAALGCQKEEIYFTSGGTEADNIAIFGAAAAKRRRGKTFITAAWEHSAVLSPMRELEKNGGVLKIIAPGYDGTLDIEKIADAVDDDTVLVSCMLVNSEVGCITDIERLVKKIKLKNEAALIHCDAVQGFGKIPFTAKKLGVDLLSVSGHKIHAPKGAGALYIKNRARILPFYYGGGQENGIRPGTEPTPAIAAFGAAAEEAVKNLTQNHAYVSKLRELFVNKASSFGDVCMNSPPEATPYICNISVLGRRSEIMLHYLAAKGIYVSSGSACSKGKPSETLKAMGLSQNRIDSAIRVSFSKYNTIDEVDAFFEALTLATREIRV